MSADRNPDRPRDKVFINIVSAVAEAILRKIPTGKTPAAIKPYPAGQSGPDGWLLYMGNRTPDQTRQPDGWLRFMSETPASQAKALPKTTAPNLPNSWRRL